MSQIQMSEIQIMPKSELLAVQILACSDFQHLGLKNSNKCVRKTNIWKSAVWAQTEQCCAQMSENRMFYVQNPTMSKIQTFYPIGPDECSDFGHKMSSENQTILFGFWTDAENRTVWNWAKSRPSEI